MSVTKTELNVLDKEAMQRFQALQSDAVTAVTERFYSTVGSAYQRFGERGRVACREDLAFHIEFLRPVGVWVPTANGELFSLAS